MPVQALAVYSMMVVDDPRHLVFEVELAALELRQRVIAYGMDAVVGVVDFLLQ